MSKKLVYCCLAELSRALQLVFEFDNESSADRKKYANQIENNFDAALTYFDRECEEKALMYARKGFDMVLDKDSVVDFTKTYYSYAVTRICDVIQDICWKQFGFKR